MFLFYQLYILTMHKHSALIGKREIVCKQLKWRPSYPMSPTAPIFLHILADIQIIDSDIGAME